MSEFDTSLIFLYSENARQKLRNLALLLKKSSQRLNYSIDCLEKEGVLYNPYCIFDYSYFGLILFRVYFKGGYISEKDRTRIINELSSNPYVVSIYELSGEYDLAIEMESPNPSRFNKEIKKLINLLPTLNNYKVLLNIVSRIYSRSYLCKNIAFTSSVDQEIIIGGDRNLESFSKNELLVMRSLLNKPQIRMSFLARESGLNIKTAASVFRALESRKIIRGFKYSINTDKVGINKFRLFLTLHNLSQEREDQLMDFMLNTKEIVLINKTVGDWDLEIDIESLDKSRLRQIIVEIRETFKDIIASFNSIEFYKYYKKSFLPRYLFDQDSGDVKIISYSN